MADFLLDKANSFSTFEIDTFSSGVSDEGRHWDGLNRFTDENLE